MRPIYETQEDLARENEIAERLIRLRGYDCHKKLDALNRTDRELFRNGKLAARVEIKTRNNASNHYELYMISANKIINGIKQREKTGIPSFLVVQFTDGLFYISMTRKLLRQREQGGRTDRNDKKDIETCCFFPSAWFKKVEELS